jgi:hypothetical protein
MKTILKLLLAALIANAAVRGGMAAYRYHQFKDAAQQAVLFGNSESEEALQQIIIDRGQALSLPVDADSVTVQRAAGRTWADASYRQPIEFFPNQEYPVEWTFTVEGYSMMIANPIPKNN